MALNEELVFQVRKNEKIDDLEEKIELLLAQNTHFVEENENLIKLVQQKNTEIDLWKRKFDTEYNNSNIAEAEKKKVFDHLNIKDQEHQIQIEKLLAEVIFLAFRSLVSRTKLWSSIIWRSWRCIGWKINMRVSLLLKFKICVVLKMAILRYRSWILENWRILLRRKISRLRTWLASCVSRARRWRQR